MSATATGRSAAIVVIAAQLERAGLSPDEAIAAAPEALERVRAAALRGADAGELLGELAGKGGAPCR